MRLWICSACLLGGLLAAGGCHGAITYNVVADTNTLIPDTETTFTWFEFFVPGPPVLERGSVVFKGGNPDRRGVYASINGQLKRIADTTMHPPGRSETFVDFRKPGISRDQVVFEGWIKTPYVHRGIYKWAHGQTSMVVDTDTTVPGEGATFEHFVTPKIDGETIGFTGHWNANQEIGIFTVSNGVIESVVKTGDLVPGTTATFTWIAGMGIDGGNVAFIGRDSRDVEGIYARIGGQLETIVDNTMTVPGTGQRFGTFRWVPAIQGDDVSFVADGIGVFARINGELRLIAGRQTTQPGTEQPFRAFGIYAPISAGHVAFRGHGPVLPEGPSRVGIYYGNGERVETIVDSFSRLGGSTARSFAIGDTGLDAGQIVFHARLNNGSEGIYVASGVGRVGFTHLSPHQHVHVAGTGGHQILYFNYFTSDLGATPYQFGDGRSTVPFVSRRWNGLFLYDYDSAAFTQSLYQYSDRFVSY